MYGSWVQVRDFNYVKIGDRVRYYNIDSVDKYGYTEPRYVVSISEDGSVTTAKQSNNETPSVPFRTENGTAELFRWFNVVEKWVPYESNLSELDKKIIDILL